MTTHGLLEKIKATWQANNEQNIKHTSQSLTTHYLRRKKKKKERKTDNKKMC